MKPEDTLTPSQFEIVRMVATGTRYATIAKKLGLSPHTVKEHFYDARVNSKKETPAGVIAWFCRSYLDKNAEREGYLRCCEVMAERRRKTRRAHKERLGVI